MPGADIDRDLTPVPTLTSSPPTVCPAPYLAAQVEEHSTSRTAASGSPLFQTYVNNRDFTGDAEAGTAGDLGPEGLMYVPWFESPTFRPLLIVGNEVSGTTTVFEIGLSF